MILAKSRDMVPLNSVVFQCNELSFIWCLDPESIELDTCTWAR